MMKRSFLLSLLLLLTALLVFSACGGDTDTPGGDTENTTLPDTTDTAAPEELERLTDKYTPGVSSISVVAGTFTDRMTADDLNEAMMGENAMAAPLLYNLIKQMNLTKDDIILYSEMNGNLLDSATIDGLFLADIAAMREAVRGEYTIMAGGMPYTVYELAFLSDDDLKALGIPEADLKAFLATVPAIAEATGEVLDDNVNALLAKYAD